MKTTTQQWFDQCLGDMWKRKMFFFRGIKTIQYYHRGRCSIEAEVYVTVPYDHRDVLRKALRDYFGKFLIEKENMTCWLNVQGSRVTINAKSDDKAPVSSCAFANKELLEALQVFLDSCND